MIRVLLTNRVTGFSLLSLIVFGSSILSAQAPKAIVASPSPKTQQRVADLLKLASRVTDAVEGEAERSFALAHLAMSQARSGNSEQAVATFAMATKAANAISKDDPSAALKRDTALSTITDCQAKSGLFDDALRTAQAIEHDPNNHHRGNAF